MSIQQKIRSNKKLKRLVYWAMIPSYEARPRKWVSWFLNPFYHKRGKHSIIRRRTRIDVLPSHRFELGDYSMIEDFSTVNNGVGDVIIGKRAIIGLGNVVIGPATIGDNVIFAQNVVLSGLNHSYEDITVPIRDQTVSTAPITIEDGCWVGANSVITAGVTIGRHSIVAGGSVVTKDVPPYSVAVGNPARIIKKYDLEKKEWVRVN